jgi:hypothetical protein
MSDSPWLIFRTMTLFGSGTQTLQQALCHLARYVQAPSMNEYCDLNCPSAIRTFAVPFFLRRCDGFGAFAVQEDRRTLSRISATNTGSISFEPYESLVTLYSLRRKLSSWNRKFPVNSA